MDNQGKTQEELRAKAPNKEDDFFRKQEEEQRRKHAEELRAREAEEEAKRLKELHYMRCPKCGQQLVEETHEEIDVDRCSACGGVWLDAGELEQLNKKEQGFFSRWFKR
ncbi:MAG: zf-TFIIB domain-containing protein [Candidatus Eremiobacterota bacterium]